jgi:uncharacterized integral membrane protein
MERFAQYLDNLEDVYFAGALLLERGRKLIQIILILTACLTVQVLGILLALVQPPLALGCVSLAVVGMLYYGATGGVRNPQYQT